MRARTIALRSAVCTIVVAAGLVASATPTSAAVSSFDVEMIRGRIRVGTTNFDTPTTPAPDCLGTPRILGTVDNVIGGAISSTVALSTGNFALPFFGGRYRMMVSGTSNTGTYTGGATGTFSGMTFSSLTFEIRTISTAATGCVVGTVVVCSGTASLTTVTGGVVTGSSIPLSLSEQAYVNGSGTITGITTGCGFPWSAVIITGAPLTLAKNPAFPADFGAIFHQRM